MKKLYYKLIFLKMKEVKETINSLENQIKETKNPNLIIKVRN